MTGVDVKAQWDGQCNSSDSTVMETMAALFQTYQLLPSTQPNSTPLLEHNGLGKLASLQHKPLHHNTVSFDTIYVLWEFYTEQMVQSVKRHFGWGIWTSLSSKWMLFKADTWGNMSSILKSEQTVASNEDMRAHYNHYTHTRSSPAHKCKESEQRRVLRVKLTEFSVTAPPKDDRKSGRTDVLWYQEDNGQRHNIRHVAQECCSTELKEAQQQVKPSQIWGLLMTLLLLWGMRKTCVRPTIQPLQQLPTNPTR